MHAPQKNIALDQNLVGSDDFASKEGMEEPKTSKHLSNDLADFASGESGTVAEDDAFPVRSNSERVAITDIAAAAEVSATSMRYDFVK